MEQVVVLFLGFLFCGLDVGMLCVFFNPCLKENTAAFSLAVPALLQQGSYLE